MVKTQTDPEEIRRICAERGSAPAASKLNRVTRLDRLDEYADLSIPISRRCHFVTLRTVTAHLGVEQEKVDQMVQEGEFLWVWNFSQNENGRKRDLRFGVWGLMNPEAARKLTLDQMINRLFPLTKENVRGVEFGVACTASRNLVEDLCRAKQLESKIKGHTRHIKTASVHAFLTRRFLGGSTI
jgi:hypothetical protein